MRWSVGALCVAGVLVALSFPPRTGEAATGVTGSTGLLLVPTADVTPNEQFAFGGVITDYQAFPAKKFSYFRDNKPSFYFGGYLTIGYIPRVEITIRGNGMPSATGPGRTGPFYTDGMISMQVLAHKGSGWMPSVGFGMQDMYGFMLFNALYGVVTWTFPGRDAGPLVISLGWATDWYNKNQGTADEDWDVNHVMNGFMAGVEYPVRRWVATLTEYDSRSLNVGVRLRPVWWCTFDVAALRWGLDELARQRVGGFGAHLHFDGRI